jgi:biotin carboxyl carrier protein
MIYQVNGLAHTIDLLPLPGGEFKVRIDGRMFIIRAEPRANGGWLLNIGGQQITAYAVAQGSERYVYAAGEYYTLTVPETRNVRRRKSHSAGDLTTQMPGQIVNVLVNAGDAVTRGQTLVILEAMKMEIRVAAPGDGRIKRLLVNKGQIVERGQLLLELEA